jgi:hypothetical protein
METKNREKMLLIAVAVCVGLWVVNMVIINPIITSWKARQTKIAELEGTISSGNTTLQSAQTIESQWDHMRTNTLNSTNASAQQGQLFKAFLTWSTNSHVALLSQKPAAKPNAEDLSYAEYEWHADVQGSLAQLVAFLYAVENGPLGLKVDSIELATRDDRGQQLAMGLTVSGLILNPPTNSVP